jgi:uncharacterized SAM-binding protein YcdF (DUF218 family)
MAVLGLWAKKLISELLLLPAGPLLLIALGLWLGRRRRTLGQSLVALGLLILVTFSLPIVANAIAIDSEQAYPPLRVDVVLPKDAAIVVLGGGLQQGATDYGGETINAVTLTRLRSAARLAARTHLPILVSGGRFPTMNTSEGEQMAASFEQDFRTPVRWIEKESLDTPDNARLSVPILKAAGITTAVLVTDAGHMQRARSLFEAAGMPVIAAPTDYYANGPVTVLSFIPNSNALRRSAWTMHEWLGLLWSRLQR